MVDLMKEYEILGQSEEMRMNEEVMRQDIVKRLVEGKELVWINQELMPKKNKTEQEEFQKEEVKISEATELGAADILDAEKRLERFAPLIEYCFPETAKRNGLIESELVEIAAMQNVCRTMGQREEQMIPGRLFLKKDSHLPIAGSIKARGGIYEVLKHTEELAESHGMLSREENYRKLAEPEFRKFFGQYTIQVGSTGNLGLSIGIISAALGYRVIVHMSADAKQWKKDLLREHGVDVREYADDYSEAVKNGRACSDADPKSYFIDDENSKTLFLGYAVAAGRLAKQLAEQKVQVDSTHPLFVYIPCGVGGAPGGIAFGLKEIFGKDVHCFFIEPTQAPCMLLGMATGLQNKIAVKDIGLSGMTHADGLAVGRPSGFVGQVMQSRLSGIFTVQDAALYEYMRKMLETEKIFLEPSACAGFEGPVKLLQYGETREYLEAHKLTKHLQDAVHIVWATGGSLVPEETREIYRNTYL